MFKIIFQRYFSTHSKICIIGGGTGGLNLSTHLLRTGINPKDIRIFQPSDVHYYQPGWTMVGANLCSSDLTHRKTKDILPEKVLWTQRKVQIVNPNKNTIETDNGQKFTYDHLIFSSGLMLQWDKIKGAKELLDNPNSNVGSIYYIKYAQKTSKIGSGFKGGQAIFTEPAPPIKCAGAPQKILYLWTDQWIKKNLPANISYIKFGGAMFGVPKYSQALAGVAKKYGINAIFNHNLIEVTDNIAIFENNQTKEKVQKRYDFLHITPPMSAHKYISQSGLGDAQGYLSVDKFTLRHPQYSNIWGIGDCTNTPNSKTAAAIFSQTQTLVKNLNAVLRNPSLTNLPSKYEGYASCPLFVGDGKLMLAEFKYDGVVDETFYQNQQKPRRLFYYMKKYFFPYVYWHIVPRGLWGGRKGFKIDI